MLIAVACDRRIGWPSLCRTASKSERQDRYIAAKGSREGVSRDRRRNGHATATAKEAIALYERARELDPSTAASLPAIWRCSTTRSGTDSQALDRIQPRGPTDAEGCRSAQRFRLLLLPSPRHAASRAMVPLSHRPIAATRAGLGQSGDDAGRNKAAIRRASRRSAKC